MKMAYLVVYTVHRLFDVLLFCAAAKLNLLAAVQE